MDENSDGAARVAHVLSAVVRGSSSEYGVSSAAGEKRKGFDRLRLSDRHCGRPTTDEGPRALPTAQPLR